MKKFYYIFLISLFFSCIKENQILKTVNGDAFGSTYSIKYYSESEFDINKGIDSILYVVNRSVSTYQKNSDISRINRGDTTVVVDKIFLDNYNISEEVHHNSKGYFDPTIGVLRNAYGFGDTQPIPQMDQQILDSLLNYVGYHKLNVTPENTIHKEYPQIYIDFNAVAKGYGIDCIGEYLEANGVTDYLIELGGELLAKGDNLEHKKNWIVGVESIDSELKDRTYTAKVTLINIAMASSGNYRKFRIDPLTGEKYVHTINPLNGKAEKSDVTSATVLAPICAYADAYATAFMALGLERSIEVLKGLKDIDVYLTYTDKDNNQQVYISEGFKKYLLE